MNQPSYISDKKGFTLVEVVMASLVVLFVAAGVWGVYWSVVNTYHVEQKGTLLQAEGERIVDLVASGGHFGGKKIYGLNSMSGVSGAGYPLVGSGTTGYFTDADDYRIEFPLDAAGGNTRYAQFYVKFDSGPTSQLWFELKTDGTTGDEHNYPVKITENLLRRKEGTDPNAYGYYTKTWFKAEKLSSVTGYCTGVKVSFYLADSDDLVAYNYKLDRLPEPPIGNPDQERVYMNSIPYPKFFSTTVYFPSRN